MPCSQSLLLPGCQDRRSQIVKIIDRTICKAAKASLAAFLTARAKAVTLCRSRGEFGRARHLSKQFQCRVWCSAVCLPSSQAFSANVNLRAAPSHRFISAVGGSALG